MTTQSKHGGKREGAGRKSALLPLRTKKFRASDEDWQEFLSFFGGDAKIDFNLVLSALRIQERRYDEVYGGNKPGEPAGKALAAMRNQGADKK